MIIDINTKLVTLLGLPLQQSFSAAMQNAGYAAAGVNMLYFYTETGPEQVGTIVNGLRYMPVAGFGITKPNKVKVMEYLDEFDPLCRKMGACNTVVKTPEGKLKGYNTDGLGFYKALTEELGVAPAQSIFHCFGAGGAGRAICSILAYHGAKKIYIVDIVEAKAAALVKAINSNFAPVAEFVKFNDFSRVAGSDVVINATGVGMENTADQTPMPKGYIKSRQIYFDACYNPARTMFLLNAESKGCQVANGLNMLLYQGTAQFELWTGQAAPVEVMRQELSAILAKK